MVKKVQTKFLALTIAFLVSNQAYSEPIYLSSSDLFVVDGVLCGKLSNSWKPGKFTRNGAFSPATDALTKQRKLLRRISNQPNSEALKKRKQQLIKRLKRRISKQTILCRTRLANVGNGNGGQLPIGITPNPVSTPKSTFRTPSLTPPVTNGTVSAPSRQSPTPLVSLTSTAVASFTASPVSTASPAGTVQVDGPVPTHSGTRIPVNTATISADATSTIPAPLPSSTPTLAPTITLITIPTVAPTTPPRTPTTTPTTAPTDQIAITLGLIDPCQDLPVQGNTDLRAKEILNLQNIPFASNIVATVKQGNGLEAPVESVVFTYNNNLTTTDNNAPFTLNPSTNSNIPPAKLTLGRYQVTATAYSAKNGRGTVLATKSIDLEVRDSILHQKDVIDLSVLTFEQGNSHRVFAPRELENGCVRAGAIVDGSLVYADFDNAAVRKIRTKTVQAGWSEGQVGIGPDGSGAVANSFYDENTGFHLPIAFFNPSGEERFKKELQTDYDPMTFVPGWEYNEPFAPQVTAQNIFASGYGTMPTYSFVNHYNLDGTQRFSPYVFDPGEIWSNDSDGYFFSSVFNSLCSTVNLSYFDASTNKTSYTEEAVHDNCEYGTKAASHGKELFIASIGINPDTENSLLYVSKFDSTGARVWHTENGVLGDLIDIAVIPNESVAVLFAAPQSVRAENTYIIMFYRMNGEFVDSKVLTLPFNPSGMRSISGGKLVIYGPSNYSSASLGDGKGRVAVLY